MNRSKNFLLFCVFIIHLSAMQQPNSLNNVNIVLEKVISRYRNPVTVKLMNIEYGKDPMADDCMSRKVFKSNASGQLIQIAWVESSATVTCNTNVPMLSIGADSQMCLLIDDELNNDEFATVWLRKYSDDKQTFFECPKIEGTKKECGLHAQILVTLELHNESRLSCRPFHFYNVNVTSQIKECFGK